MAVRGAKPKPNIVKLVTGNPGKRALPEGVPEPGGVPVRPAKLRKREGELWDQFIATAFWLTEHDSAKAHMWVCLHAEWEKKPSEMVSARIGQLRALGSELGLDPASRVRLGGGGKKAGAEKDEFFDD